MASYTHAACATALEPFDLDLKLIFIVGMPRSGTTLVEQILASHDEVNAGGELPLVQDCLRMLERRGGDHADPRLLEDLRELYIDGLFERELDGRYVTDKLPGNFASLGLIRRLFPDSTIVHCRRQPVAVCWSLYTANFGMHEPYYNSFEHLAHYHSVYERLMRHWQSTLSPPIVDVQYERLVLDPETEARRLLAGCGLAWDPRCLDFHAARRPVYTASQAQVRRPIYETSIARWKHYAKHLTPLIEYLGVSS